MPSKAAQARRSSLAEVKADAERITLERLRKNAEANGIDFTEKRGPGRPPKQEDSTIKKEG